MRNYKIILPALIVLISLCTASLSFSAKTSPEVKKARALIESFRKFDGSDSAAERIERDLAIDVFLERALSEFWDRDDFKSYKPKITKKFREVLKLSTYHLMKKFFLNVDIKARYIEIPKEGMSVTKKVPGLSGSKITADFVKKMKSARDKKKKIPYDGF